MTIAALKIADDAERETLVALLADNHLITYTAYTSGKIAGAVVVRWDGESEIELLAVDAARRGQGIGRAIVAAIIEEARRRGITRLLVGTGNFSLDNIAFYQKCGFRMSHVRRGYFDNIDPPEFWQGIRLRDMIVFDYELAEVEGRP